MTKKNYINNNIFHKIIKKEINCEKIKENEFCLCFKDIDPIYEKHYLIIPKNLYYDFSDFITNAKEKEVFIFWKFINEIIQENCINGYKLITNSGQDGNQEIPHFHIHLMFGKKL